MNKDLLLGVGIGLLLAAIMLTLFPKPSQSLTDLQVIEAAKELGMTFNQN